MPSRRRYEHSCSVPREQPHTHLLTTIYCGELVWSPRVDGRVGSKWGGDELPSLKEKTKPNAPARPQPKHPHTYHCGGVPAQPCRGCHLDFKRQQRQTGQKGRRLGRAAAVPLLLPDISRNNQKRPTGAQQKHPEDSTPGLAEPGPAARRALAPQAAPAAQRWVSPRGEVSAPRVVLFLCGEAGGRKGGSGMLGRLFAACFAGKQD